MDCIVIAHCGGENYVCIPATAHRPPPQKNRVKSNAVTKKDNRFERTGHVVKHGAGLPPGVVPREEDGERGRGGRRRSPVLQLHYGLMGREEKKASGDLFEGGR